MTRILLTAALLTLLSGRPSEAQKKWSLEDCVTYGLANNLQLKRQQLQTENAKVTLTKSRLDLLPNLNFESDGRIGFGRSIDPVTNLITFKQNVSNSYSLSTSISLFNGFAGLNTLSANKFMLKAGVESEKIAENTLILNITGSYYQVVYAMGLEAAAQKQLEISEKQLFRITRNVEVGREALSRQYEMESKVSEARLNHTVAVNNTSQALTSLRQLLQVDASGEFEVSLPPSELLITADSIYNPVTVFEKASENLPRLKALNYESAAASHQVAAAKGGLLPRLSVGGAIFTGFYKVLSEGDLDQDAFSKQLKNNNSQAVYMTLQIPLFNNYTTGRNIKVAQLRRSDTELKLEQEKNTLFTEIENACLAYNRGRDEYAAASANISYNKKSFEAMEKKFESGLIDVTDYSTAAGDLYKAETEVLRTRLQLMIRKITIQFYETGEYQNIINF